MYTNTNMKILESETYYTEKLLINKRQLIV